VDNYVDKLFYCGNKPLWQAHLDCPAQKMGSKKTVTKQPHANLSLLL
jgi:hypothetical protein